MAYPGGKGGSGTYQKIINRIPPHTTYIEPFLGGGSIMRWKRPARLNIGVDLDAEVIAHWQSLTAGSGDCGSTACIPDDDGRWIFYIGDGIEFLRSYPYIGGELVYCDPPYLHATRRDRELYRYEMTDSQHAELLTVLLRLPCLVLVSGYWSTLYADTLAAWWSCSFQAMTRGGIATEWLWSNYPSPTALHDDRYLGANFRKRESLRRKQTRWAARVTALPILEQQALLTKVLGKVGPTVRTEVLRSALATGRDEALIASDDVPAAHRHLAIPDPPSPARVSRCTLCRHPHRLRIDQALAAGVSIRTIAKQEDVSKSVVDRHNKHVSRPGLSHFQTAQSGTPGTATHQGQPRASRQLELLSLDIVG